MSQKVENNFVFQGPGMCDITIVGNDVAMDFSKNPQAWEELKKVGGRIEVSGATVGVRF